MDRLTRHFSLEPQVDADGRVNVTSANTAMGLLICLMGFFCAGIFILMFFGLGGPAEWHDLRREPVRIHTRGMNRMAVEINRRRLEHDPDAEPLPMLPEIVRNDPGGLDREGFGLLLLNHAFMIGGVLVGVVGLRIMFTGTTVIFDKQRELVTWRHQGIRDVRSTTCARSEVELVLHETLIRNSQGLDWKCFGVTLVTKERASVLLARGKDKDGLKQYAGEFRKLTGVKVKEVGAE